MNGAAPRSDPTVVAHVVPVGWTPRPHERGVHCWCRPGLTVSTDRLLVRHRTWWRHLTGR